MQKAARDLEVAKPAAQSRVRGMLLMVLAVTLFSCVDSTAKYLIAVGHLPVTQVVWVRFLSQFIAVMLVLGLVSVPRLAATRRRRHQLLRSALLLASTVFNFLALRYLRLDQTVTIQFLAPLIVALLAGPFLGEWVGWRRMIAIVVGFGGVLIVLRPGFADFQPALLLALGTVLCYSAFILLTRYLAAFDPPEVTLFYSLLVGTYLTAPLALVDWVWPTEGWLWALMISIGLWAAAGHYVFIIAHRFAPASTIAPFMYTQLVSVAAIGYWVFGDLPDLWTLSGSAVIVASGIYLWHRERVTSALRQEPPRPR